MTEQIHSMLTDAYCQLGIRNTTDLHNRVTEAMDYLARDREHDIEVAHRDVPEHLISQDHSIHCKLIPLAWETTQIREATHILRQEGILSLMVSDGEVRYVYACTCAKLCPNPADNTYSYPVYRYAEPEDFHSSLRPDAPQQIRPAATAADLEIHRMISTVYENLCLNYPANTVPHKTERALVVAAYTVPETFSVAGQAVTGKLVPLASGNSASEEIREDHRRSSIETLCLLIGQDELRYVMKTRHLDQCFRKVILDDFPGGCIYEPLEDRLECTFAYVAPENIPQDMIPLYN